MFPLSFLRQYLLVLCLVLPLSPLRGAESIFAQTNLMAWCIVPIDAGIDPAGIAKNRHGEFWRRNGHRGRSGFLFRDAGQPDTGLQCLDG